MKAGTHLATLLAQNGIKKKDFAAAMGVHPGTITRWVNNSSNWNEDRMHKVAEFFGVSVNEHFNVNERRSS